METVYREHAKRRLTDTVRRMRAHADRLERMIDDFDLSKSGYTRYSHVAGYAVHEVMTFLANAHFESMTQYAAEADAAIAERNAANPKG